MGENQKLQALLDKQRSESYSAMQSITHEQELRYLADEIAARVAEVDDQKSKANLYQEKLEDANAELEKTRQQIEKLKEERDAIKTELADAKANKEQENDGEKP